MASGRSLRRRRRVIERSAELVSTVPWIVALVAAAAVAAAGPAEAQQRAEQSAEPTTEQPAEPTANQPAEESAERPAEPTAAQTAEQPTEQTAEAGAEHEGGAEALDAFLDEVTVLQADFVQETRSADGSLLETSSGTLSLRRPSRFRWHESQPYELLVVADGENLWIYDVELEQATVAPLDENVASSPAMLLSGDRAVRDGFSVVDRFTRDGLEWVQLVPKLEGTDFRLVVIGFEGTSPRRLELVNSLNQITLIELSNVAVNPELDDEVFEFDPPRGVDVIGTPG